MKFINSTAVCELGDVTQRAYQHNWDERNGGNVSLRLSQKYLDTFEDVGKVIRTIPIEFDASKLIGQYFLVTGTGRYFKNVQQFPERDAGLVRIAPDGHNVDLMWGFNDGGEPTSEFPAHLMTHISRQKIDSDQRCVMHCHPTNLIGMSFTLPLSERKFSRILWKMQAESIVVFPEGLGIIPYMTPGTNEIGSATAKKMEQYKAVLWPHHGIFGTGSSLDETFGLIETVEKAALIYTTIRMQGGDIKQTITDQDLKDLSERFHVQSKDAFLNKCD